MGKRKLRTGEEDGRNCGREERKNTGGEGKKDGIAKVRRKEGKEGRKEEKE